MKGGLTIYDMEERKRKAEAYDRLMYRRRIQAEYLKRHRVEVNRRRRMRNEDGSMKPDHQMDEEALSWCERTV